MGYLSQAGHIGIKTQATKGTYRTPAMGTPGTANPLDGVFLYTKSGSLSANRELLIPDAEIGGNRDVTDAQLGPISYSGEFEFYARMDALPTLLAAALGNSTTTPTGTGTLAAPWTHTVTPTDGSLPWLSVEQRLADGYMTFKYTDCKINTLHLEAEANGYLSGTMGLVGLKQEILVTETPVLNRDYDTSPMIVGTNVKVRFATALLPAKSFSIDINNNLEDDDFRLGSFYLGDIVEKRREVTMAVTIRPDSAELWKRATWGSTTATEAGGMSSKAASQIVFESYEIIPGTTSSVYSTTIDIASSVIAPFMIEPSGDDVIEHDLEIRALRPNPATPILTAVIKNGLSTIR